MERVIGEYQTDKLRNGMTAIKARFGSRGNRPIVLLHADPDTVQNVTDMLNLLMAGKELVRCEDGTYEVVDAKEEYK